jgi:hypothetical protein
MKTNLKRLVLTAMLLSSTSISFADQNANSVGDLPGSVGDLPGFGEIAYFHEDATYAENAEVAPITHVGDSHVGDLPMEAPLEEQFQPASYSDHIEIPVGEAVGEEVIVADEVMLQAPAGSYMGVSPYQYGYASGYEVACDDACDAAWGKQRKLFSLFDCCGTGCWATTEALMWFAPDRNMPALITTSDPGTLPVLPEGGLGNVKTVFGDDIDGEISGGFRLDYGKYLTENIGIGGRFWWMANNDDSYYASGDGTQGSIGRPFYNIDIPSNDALLVAIEPVLPVDPDFSGMIAARSELKLWAAEGYARMKLACNKGCQLDLIGGYSHFEIQDKLGISSATIDNDTARVRQYVDLFNTDNRFDGGQVGFEMMLTHGRWMARSLTKVHLGNMDQRVRILGGSSDQTPPVAPSITSGGLLAMGNQGEYSRDKFAFVPEANFKLGYCLRKNVFLSVGYSLIYWDNVCLVGDVIDPTADGLLLNTGQFGNRPAFEFNDSSLWVQGLDLGITIDL